MTWELLLLSTPCLVACAVVISLEVIVAISKRKTNKQDRMEVKCDDGFYEAFEFLKDYAEELSNHKNVNKTGMKKIEELKNRLSNLAMTDDRPALWRLCRSLVESLDEVQKEHDAELEDIRKVYSEYTTALDDFKQKSEESEAKIKELEGQLKAMSDLANSAMADAQKRYNRCLEAKAEVPMLPPPLPGRVWYLDGKPVDESLIMSQQAKTAREAQEERIPRNGYHKYHIKFYSYKNHQWHETNLWCGGIEDVEDWVIGACGGGIPVYDCKVIA